jgi:hypothetical protein
MLTTRRIFTSLLFSLLGIPLKARTENAGRSIDLKIGSGFGEAREADIAAVLKSAADSIWKYCPETRWEVPGFFIFRSEKSPITYFDHRLDDRIAIGLDTQDMLWSQFAYQFSHEFCHALAGHANDWRKTWIRADKANHWLEESLCETASLFALREMAKTWRAAPPFPNWRDYAKSLNEYAENRLNQVAARKGAGFEFQKWFAENESSMRSNPTIREKNDIVAGELLPLFESTPGGWESVTFYNLGENRNPSKSLRQHFADWRTAAPALQHDFIDRMASVFGVRVL